MTRGFLNFCHATEKQGQCPSKVNHEMFLRFTDQRYRGDEGEDTGRGHVLRLPAAALFPGSKKPYFRLGCILVRGRERILVASSSMSLTSS